MVQMAEQPRDFNKVTDANWRRWFVAAAFDRVATETVDPAKHLSELLKAVTLADEVGRWWYTSGNTTA
jgi:hypothetical protein